MIICVFLLLFVKIVSLLDPSFLRLLVTVVIAKMKICIFMSAVFIIHVLPPFLLNIFERVVPAMFVKLTPELRIRWRLIFKLYCSILSTLAIYAASICVLFILYGHYFICFDNECNPIPSALIQFQEISSANNHKLVVDASVENMSIYSMMNPIIDCGENNKKFINKSSIFFSLIIGQRRGGTSWLRKILKSHPQIIDLNEEILRKWYNLHCSRFKFLLNERENHECTAQSMINWMNTAFLNEIEAFFCSDHHSESIDRIVFVGKIQIEQLFGDHMLSLIEYIQINQISVIHFERGASIASCLSYSMDQIERVSNVNTQSLNGFVERDRSKKNKKLSQNAIYLEPSLALDYVSRIEQKHAEFQKFVMESNETVQYMHIYYEYLMDSVYSNNAIYLKMIESFLQIEHQMNFTEVSLKREHPLPCFAKISNWKQIENKLQSMHSISAIACKKILS